jgi:TonB family protein
MPDLPRLWCIALTILISIGASFGNPPSSQAESPQESFRGSFSQDLSEALASDKDSLISPSLVFIESNSGKKYATFAQFFYNLSLRREYLLEGIVVQKHLPAKSKSGDYKRIVQLAWPDISSSDLKLAAKNVEAWIKKNPDKPLLLISSIRPEFSQMRKGPPIDVEGRVQSSKLISRVEPVYPQAAKLNRISGTVVLQIIVDEQGIVEQIKPTSGHPLLTTAAIQAVQHWKYSPTVINGQAVPVQATVTVIFGLR